MPFPSEHSCRLKDPDAFQDNSFRRISRKHEGKKYDIIIGKLKGETTTTEQSYRYSKNTWESGEAKSHCEDHDGTFEAASGEESRVETSNITANRPKRSIFKRRPMGMYKIESKIADEATVYLYDEISPWGIDAEQFVKDLNDLAAKTIHLRVNSPGGSVFDGIAIYNAVKQHKSHIIAHIDGLAASIASVIVMGAAEIRAAESAFLMIHRPWSIIIGDADMMRAEADLLDKVGDTIAKIYEAKSGKAAVDILNMMSAETWLTGPEALENGFVDMVEELEEDRKARISTFDLSIFANAPPGLAAGKRLPTERELEQILRDAGCSIKQAKAILATGFPEDLRDVDSKEEPSAEAQGQRDVELAAQRDVAQPEAMLKPKNKTNQLLIKGESMGF